MYRIVNVSVTALTLSVVPGSNPIAKITLATSRCALEQAWCRVVHPAPLWRKRLQQEMDNSYIPLHNIVGHRSHDLHLTVTWYTPDSHMTYIWQSHDLRTPHRSVTWQVAVSLPYLVLLLWVKMVLLHQVPKQLMVATACCHHHAVHYSILYQEEGQWARGESSLH